MPVIGVTLNAEQFNYVMKIAEATEVDLGAVIRALIDLELKKTASKVSHPLTILTEEDDSYIVHLRDVQGCSWPKVVEGIQARKRIDTISRGAVIRAYQRALRKSLK